MDKGKLTVGRNHFINIRTLRLIQFQMQVICSHSSFQINGGLQNPILSEKWETVNDVKHRIVDMALTFNELVGSKQRPFITPSTSITFVVAMMILIINSIYYPHRDGVVQKAKRFLPYAAQIHEIKYLFNGIINRKVSG